MSVFIYLDNFLKIIRILKKSIFNFFFVKAEKSNFFKKINFQLFHLYIKFKF